MSHEIYEDTPKLLGHARARAARRAELSKLHVAPLARFVESLRTQIGPNVAIPDFDPWDGGTAAEILYLLEAPGARAVLSGFISRNNPDETAKNFFELNLEAGIPRTRTVTWNIVPWYIGSGKKIRAANQRDITAGCEVLVGLIDLLPRLRAVVFVGRKAARAGTTVRRYRPNLPMFFAPHPSPLFINNAPENRLKILAVLREVANFLSQPASC